MSTIHIVGIGASSMNSFGPVTGMKELLLSRLQSVRSAHCRFTSLAANGRSFFSQLPTGYSMPSAVSTWATRTSNQTAATPDTTWNITNAIARRPRPYGVMFWQPTPPIRIWETDGGVSTVGGMESAIDTDVMPMYTAMKDACTAAGVNFYVIGNHPWTATLTSTEIGSGNVSNVTITGFHYIDQRLATGNFGIYVNGLWNTVAVGTGYNNSTDERAQSSFMDAGGGHFTAATHQTLFDNYVKNVLGFETINHHRTPLDISP